MDSSGDGKVLPTPQACGITRQCPGTSAGRVFQVGVFRADEVRFISFLGRCVGMMALLSTRFSKALQAPESREKKVIILLEGHRSACALFMMLVGWKMNGKRGVRQGASMDGACGGEYVEDKKLLRARPWTASVLLGFRAVSAGDSTEGSVQSAIPAVGDGSGRAAAVRGNDDGRAVEP